MEVHKSHKMVVTPIGTVECAYCWACGCHADPSIFTSECKKTFATE